MNLADVRSAIWSRVLELLRDELVSTMQSIGAACVARIDGLVRAQR